MKIICGCFAEVAWTAINRIKDNVLCMISRSCIVSVLFGPEHVVCFPWNQFAIPPREYEIDLRHACDDRLFETIFSAPALFCLFPDANSGETSHLEDSSSLISPFITMDVTISSPFNRSSIFSRRVRGYVCELKLSHIARYCRVSYSSRTPTAELISYLRFLDFKFFEPNS